MNGPWNSKALFIEVIMKINTEWVTIAFREARNLRDVMDQYCIHPGGTSTSLDVVTEAVKQTCGKPVIVKRLPFKTERLCGIFLPYDDRFEVIVDSDMAPFWDRYIAVKEMGHIVLLDPDNVTNDPVDTIEWLVQDGLGSLDDDSAPIDVANEELAKVIAYEVLLPREERDNAIQLLKADPFNLFILSLTYELPEHVVEYVLSDKYQLICAKMYPLV
jgi:Zn-dependent peptidase ImmA (M78 family)